MCELGSLCNWACSVFQWQNTWACVEVAATKSYMAKNHMWASLETETHDVREATLKLKMLLVPQLLTSSSFLRRSSILCVIQRSILNFHVHIRTHWRLCSAAARKLVICKLEKITIWSQNDDDDDELIVVAKSVAIYFDKFYFRPVCRCIDVARSRSVRTCAVEDAEMFHKRFTHKIRALSTREVNVFEEIFTSLFFRWRLIWQWE